MRPLRLLIVVVLAGGLLPLATPSAAFEEVPTDAVPLQELSDMEVSDEYVFLLGSPGTDIVVFDHTATLLGTISGLTNAISMFLDGADLWVGMAGEDHIDRYDVSGSLPFPVTAFDISPFLFQNSGTLAVAGGRVWFEGSGSTAIPLDPSDGSLGAAVSVGAGPGGNRLLAAPEHPSALWVASFNSATRFEAVGDTLTLQADVNLPGSSTWSSVGRDGSSYFVPRTSPDGATELNGATLQQRLPRPRYRAPGVVRGAAPNPTGRRLAVVSSHPNTDRPRLTIFNTQNRAVVFDRQLLTAGFAPSDWAANLAAYSPDGSNLFLVLGRGASRTPWLLALPGVPKETSLRITPGRTRLGVVTPIVVHLFAFASTTNRQVRLFMEPEGQANRLVRSAQVNAKGDLVFRVRLLRSTTFTAEWDGDASYFAQSGQRRVGVQALVKGVLSGFYGTSSAYRLYHHGSRPLFAARVRPSTPTKQGERVRFILDRLVNGGWRRAGVTVVQMSQQNFAAVRLIGWAIGSYRIHAVFLGDEFHASTPSRYSFLRITN